MSSQLFIGSYGGTDRDIRVTPTGEGCYTVEIAGETHEVDARRFAGGNWSVIIDGQSYDVELEVAGPNESDGHYNSLVRGRVVQLVVRDERRVRMAITSSRFRVEGPQTVLSPMPGKIVKILVDVGREVTEGQPLVIVEAMKMENELRSPKKGKVSAVMVKEGQGVEAGSKLLAVE
jgi:biotin carboxyl carrier protein